MEDHFNKNYILGCDQSFQLCRGYFQSMTRKQQHLVKNHASRKEEANIAKSKEELWSSSTALWSKADISIFQQKKTAYGRPLNLMACAASGTDTKKKLKKNTEYFLRMGGKHL